VTFVEFAQVGEDEDAATLAAPFGEVDLLSAEDVDELAAGLQPNSSAAVLVFEHTWAAPLKQAIEDSGGRLVESLITLGFLSFFFLYLLRLLNVIDTPFKVGQERIGDDSAWSMPRPDRGRPRCWPSGAWPTRHPSASPGCRWMRATTTRCGSGSTSSRRSGSSSPASGRPRWACSRARVRPTS
jgi:hypothetical protein